MRISSNLFTLECWLCFYGDDTPIGGRKWDKVDWGKVAVKDSIVSFYKDFTAKREFDAQYIGARPLCCLISIHTKDLRIKKERTHQVKS